MQGGWVNDVRDRRIDWMVICGHKDWGKEGEKTGVNGGRDRWFLSLNLGKENLYNSLIYRFF